ncbi:uncharacterized protein BYT42DRAFT_491840 [Radiomyces spectabilis]|uniref:uncharacterized protein n=1 Tax=Radiomyces spectabilis TaxID=64574 RepID=UPI002220F908|nr:uncharacterized protein BYT42DRAFT_491840 [Radiomyces spectabilis]KAI8388305.1 hypothetical protein BYT42DRAFT_491840 [Radiomyces spectabilis]
MADALQDIQNAFALEPHQFQAIVQGFKSELNSGLATMSASGLATMIPSYVTKLPTGRETGTYLALDLGGSTLRVCAVELLGHGQVTVTEVKRSIAVKDPLRTGTAEAFFDWIVDTVHELVQKINVQTPLVMGVCWSFPLDQKGIATGLVLRMGKGFDLKGIDNKDLQSLFKEAFQRKGLDITVTALLNDTVGTLVAHAYANPKVRVGFIYGTGVNAAYPEKVQCITKLQDTWPAQDATQEMLVNTEIDIFGSDDYLPLNRFDLALDAQHTQPKFQLYEKMMSGAYLGELVRLAGIELIDQRRLFQGHMPLQFTKSWGFETAHLSAIEKDRHEPDALDRIGLLFTFDDYTMTATDLTTIADLCKIVATRGAHLAAAAMCAIIEQQPQMINSSNDIVIGVTGSTFEMYAPMSDRIMHALTRWFDASVAQRIRIEPATDGSSIGAALVAMLYQQR